jgi:hypothetical protein
MVRQRFVEVIAQVPSGTQPVYRQLEELALGSNPFEEHQQLELEKDDWIDTRSPTVAGVAGPDKVAHEREIERSIHVPVEVVGGHQLVQGNSGHWREEPGLRAHHGRPPFSPSTATTRAWYDLRSMTCAPYNAW